MAEYEEEKEAFAGDLKIIEQEEKELQLKIDAYDKLRAELITKIDGKLLTKYEVLVERNIIPSAVEISASHCLGCALSIPAQLFNEIIQHSSGVCPHCGRLLFYKEPEKPEPKVKAKAKAKTKKKPKVAKEAVL